MNISVCITTYRRQERLELLLDDLVKQELLPSEVIVVDNDATGSAHEVVEKQIKSGTPFPIHYDIQPVKNISLTRNRTVALAKYDWIAFIDDNERAPVLWLSQLAKAITECKADGVLGPVVPIVPLEAPDWIQRGHFYDWSRLETGEEVPLNKLRFGNVILRASILRTSPEPFDTCYGLTGGEDGDLLMRLAQQGACIVWCDEAIVLEPVESTRLSLRWLLLRAFHGGQDFARHKLNGRFGNITLLGQIRLLLRAFVFFVISVVLMIFHLPFGRHRAAHWLLKASANLGKLSIYLVWHCQACGEKAI